MYVSNLFANGLKSVNTDVVSHWKAAVQLWDFRVRNAARLDKAASRGYWWRQWPSKRIFVNKKWPSKKIVFFMKFILGSSTFLDVFNDEAKLWILWLYECRQKQIQKGTTSQMLKFYLVFHNQCRRRSVNLEFFVKCQFFHPKLNLTSLT